MARSLNIGVALALCSAPTSLSAEEWWWVGANGEPPNRVLTYVDLDAVRSDGETTIVEAVAIAETDLATGQRSQRTGFGIRCGQREFQLMYQRGFDSAGNEIALAPIIASDFQAVAPGSIAEAVFSVACRSPAGHEIQVANPQLHAAASFGQPQGNPVTQSGRLYLVCLGAGSANRPTSTWATARNSSGESSSATIIGNRSVPFEDQVNLWIEGNEGRLRMPRSMLPPIRGGENGWFELRDIEMSEGEITGKVAINIISNPNLRLDRYTGAISISGRAGDYVGQCLAYDPESAERQF